MEVHVARSSNDDRLLKLTFNRGGCCELLFLDAMDTPPPRPTFITPPASPPAATRPSVTAPGPSASSSVRRSSSAATNEEIERKREASVDRLHEKWAQLARYYTPLEEDDIVDLRAMTVVQDRGRLFRMRRRVFSPKKDEVGSPETKDEATAPEVEDEAGDPEVENNVNANPKDAYMFKEFEEAEKVNAPCGSAGDEEDEVFDPESDEEDKPKPVRRRRVSTPPRADDLSDDEFASWDFDAEGLPPQSQSHARSVLPVPPPKTSSSKKKSARPSFPGVPKPTTPSSTPPSHRAKRQRVSDSSRS